MGQSSKEGEEKFGPITVLVNNAGILGPIAKTADLDYAGYLKVIEVNQHAPFLGNESRDSIHAESRSWFHR
jgi:NAD(P)-dependent dehydrogenase (short-subunit alcohol dehydrogenase family)